MIRITILMLAVALVLSIPAQQNSRAVQIGYCGGIDDIDRVRQPVSITSKCAPRKLRTCRTRIISGSSKE